MVPSWISKGLVRSIISRMFSPTFFSYQPFVVISLSWNKQNENRSKNVNTYIFKQTNGEGKMKKFFKCEKMYDKQQKNREMWITNLWHRLPLWAFSSSSLLRSWLKVPMERELSKSVSWFCRPINWSVVMSTSTVKRSWLRNLINIITAIVA